MLRAYFRAALGDVTGANSSVFFEKRPSVRGVQRVHFKGSESHHVPWSEEDVFALTVTEHMANVLAQEALDAFAKLLDAIDVDLLHPQRFGASFIGKSERFDLLRNFVVPTDVGNEVFDYRKRFDRRHDDRLILRQFVDSSFAQQLRFSVDLSAA